MALTLLHKLPAGQIDVKEISIGADESTAVAKNLAPPPPPREAATKSRQRANKGTKSGREGPPSNKKKKLSVKVIGLRENSPTSIAAIGSQMKSIKEDTKTKSAGFDVRTYEEFLEFRKFRQEMKRLEKESKKNEKKETNRKREKQVSFTELPIEDSRDEQPQVEKINSAFESEITGIDTYDDCQISYPPAEAKHQIVRMNTVSSSLEMNPAALLATLLLTDC